MIDVVLYVLIGVACANVLVSQRITETKKGPDGAIALQFLFRLFLIAGWLTFSYLTGYWQIAVIFGITFLVALGGINAKKAPK